MSHDIVEIVSEGAPASEAADSPELSETTSMITWALICKLAPLWPLLIAFSIAGGVIGPSAHFITLDFFANEAAHKSGIADSNITCETTPRSPRCRAATDKAVDLAVILGTVAPVMHILFAPWLGALSDAIGRRPVIAVCSVLKFTHELFRGLHMFCGLSLRVSFFLIPLADIPFAGVCFAYMADLAPKTKLLAAMFAFSTALGGVGALLGQAIGSMLSLKTAYMVSFVISALATLYTLFLPESLSPENRSAFKRKHLIPGVSFAILFRTPLLRLLTFATLVCTFADAGFGRLGGPFLSKYFDWTKQASYVNSIIYTSAGIVWQGLLLQPTTTALGEVGVLAFARWSGQLSKLMFFFSAEVWQIWLGSAVFEAPVSLCFPVAAALKSRAVSRTEQGLLQGALGTAVSIVSAIAPPIYGALWKSAGHNPSIGTLRGGFLSIDCFFNVLVLACILIIPGRLQQLYVKEGRKATNGQTRDLSEHASLRK
jgi:DHA1 family tetracycline resistance protein-like MFS transporter